MLTRKFHDAALYINPHRAREIADQVCARNGWSNEAANVTKKIRRLADRWTVEHGHAIVVHTVDGSELYLAEGDQV